MSNSVNERTCNTHVCFRSVLAITDCPTTDKGDCHHSAMQANFDGLDDCDSLNDCDERDEFTEADDCSHIRQCNGREHAAS
jgi:hypothetical protein